MTFNNNEDFRSQFNAGWVNKLIIGIDEVLFERREDSERLKNLATARIYKSEAKNKDRVQSEFFGKFILCSNNEHDFIRIDPGENRYWIRKIQPLKQSDDRLLEKMEMEIPAFLYFLKNRKIKYKNENRLYFEPELIKTKALRKVIAYSSSKEERKLIYLFKDIIDSIDIDSIDYANKDILAVCKQRRIKLNRAEISNLLRRKWGLTPFKHPSTYQKYLLNRDGTIYKVSDKGRYFKITKNLIDEKLVDFVD